MDPPTPCSYPNPCRSDNGVLPASTKPKKRAGRTKFKETRHPVYRGVRMRKSNKWVCEVREPNKKTRIWLGTYPTAEMAARAHDVAALALRGDVACLNFADSTWRLPVPISNDAADIRKAAAEAAEAFRPKDMEVDGGDGRRDVIVNDDIGCSGSSEGEGTAAEEMEMEVESFVDEEAVFYMHRLIADMAEGLLIPPPRCLRGWSSDDVECPDADMFVEFFNLTTF